MSFTSFNMRRFVVFSGDHYYPTGGWSDMHAAYDTLDEAKDGLTEIAGRNKYTWGHIVDLTTGQIVHRS